ncbi:MAG: flagellar biosynthetic protein FliQ [Vampirovibrionales bacterium]
MQDILLEHVKHGFSLVLLISVPMISLAAIIGLVIGVIQAVTQLQEQTLTTVPKILIIGVILIVGGPILLDMMGDYLVESMQIAFQQIPEGRETVLDSHTATPRYVISKPPKLGEDRP